MAKDTEQKAIPTDLYPRVASVRHLRRMIDRVTREAFLGLRPASDVTAITNACKSSAELYLLEHQVKKMGIGEETDGEDDGGFNAHGSAVFKNRKVVIKRGETARGHVDETTITVEGGEDVELADVPEDIRALL